MVDLWRWSVIEALRYVCIHTYKCARAHTTHNTHKLWMKRGEYGGGGCSQMLCMLMNGDSVQLIGRTHQTVTDDTAQWAQIWKGRANIASNRLATAFSVCRAQNWRHSWWIVCNVSVSCDLLTSNYLRSVFQEYRFRKHMSVELTNAHWLPW